MSDIIKSSLMHDILHSAPVPRPLSIILAFAFWGNQMVGSMSHSEVNLWLATCVSLFAFVRYGHDFYKWFKNGRK